METPVKIRILSLINEIMLKAKVMDILLHTSNNELTWHHGQVVCLSRPSSFMRF